MIKFLHLFIILLFTLSAYGQIGPLSENAKIQIDNEKYDFGDISIGTKLEHNFKITNIGTDTLKIYKVKSTWGCTAVLLSSEAIMPGDTAFVKTIVESSIREGRISKSVTIYSNDYYARKKRVYIRANVVPAYRAENK